MTSLTFDPLRSKAKCGTYGHSEDQREMLWMIREKRPKLVVGSGMCTLLCAVLYHEQIRRGAWFLHDLIGDAPQLSLLCMIRCEYRHDVYALRDARDRRDGGRVSFLTNSHILPDGWEDPNVERIWTPRSARVFSNKVAT